MYKKENFVIDNTDSKQSALYFQKVLPATACSIRQILQEYDNKDEGKQRVLTLLPDIVLHPETRGIDTRYTAWMDHVDAVAYNQDVLTDRPKLMAQLEEYGRYLFRKLYVGHDLYNRPYITDYSDTYEDVNAPLDPLISLANIPILKTQNLSWPEIFDIRDDPEAINKLRKLRLFLYENYAGKSKNYIEDDLLKRIDDFESVCAQWNFETRTGTLRALLSSKLVGAGAMASFVSALLGNESAAIVTIASGITVEIAKIALEFNSSKVAYEDNLKRHDLAFLLDVKTREINDSSSKRA